MLRIRVWLVLALVTLPSVALGHVYQYAAILSGAHEPLANASSATGTALVVFDLDLHTLEVEAAFDDLLGNVTAATINASTISPLTSTAISVTAPPSLPDFPLAVKAGEYSNSINLDNASSYNPDFLNAHGPTLGETIQALYAGLEEGRAYFNIATSAYPDGEIRGFLIRLLGDFNHDLVVNAADYTVWRNSLHEVGEGLAADTNHDDVVDVEDYLAWRDNYGNTVADLFPGSGSSVPEPVTSSLVCTGVAVLLAMRTGRRRS